ncbi:MAG: glycosyltransferase family 2 protein [Chitinispirillales bacterium]|jgi:cellulose synthase/poly-beta-1,6-N-acetylglucosamine synthase-like glycosyltransferase|nr:glycosyltransferase family 2 protein [Chitinispirillales bacterium]
MNIQIGELILSITLPLFLIALSFLAFFLKKKYAKKYRSKNFTPKCAIFIPCKGITDDFERNIERFFELPYPNYELFFAVESETDVAVGVIRQKIDFYKKGTLVVSEQTKFCGQKNLNLVRAVEKSGENIEIFIFADSDIAPKSNWLDSLIRPFENEKITAASGFRWLYSKTSNIGAIVHSFQNYVLFVLFVMSAKLFNSGLWGGSMAIRKKDYDALKIRERWIETSVDDLSLAEILVKNKKKIEFCFDAITDTDDTINSYFKAEKWFVRQVQYLKYHQRISWFFAILLSLVSLFMFVRITIIVILAIVKFDIANLLLPIFFLGGIYWFATMFCLYGVKSKIVPFVFYAPLSLFNVCICVIKTAFIGVIDWSGYRYFMNFWDGKVKKTEKL